MRYLKIFIIVNLLLCFFLLANTIFADTTTVLRPIADGGEDKVVWRNAAGQSCNTVDCYLEVDEESGSSCTNSDGDISYIQNAFVSESQTFDIDESSIPNNSKITQIDINICYRQEGPVTNTLQTRRCINDSCTNSGTDITPSATYTETTQSHTGLNITKTISTDIEIGLELVGSAGRMRISQISAVITYTLPPYVAPPPPTDTGGTIGAGRMVFAGQSYPDSKINILAKSSLKDDYVSLPIEESTISTDGNFNIAVITALEPDILFILEAEDKEGRESGILPFTVSSFSSPGEASTFTKKDIFIPPTIDFKKRAVDSGDDINIEGFAAPNNTVNIIIDNELFYETQSDEKGYYSFSKNTAQLDSGEHYAKAQQIDKSDRISKFSLIKVFKVHAPVFLKADFNKDRYIDISDWSIFLFNWNSQDQALQNTIDLDESGIIDIADFSIFLKEFKN